MEKKKLNGIWIPIEILSNEKLTDKEKILISIIISLSTESGFCYANNRYLSKILNVSMGRVSKLLSSLKEKEFITIDLIYEDDTKKIERREIRPIVIYNHTPFRKELGGYGSNEPRYNINNIIYSINNKNYKNFFQRNYPDGFLNQLYENYKKIDEEQNND